MSRQCSRLVEARVRADFDNRVATDVYRVARELHRQLADVPEHELVSLIDIAIIGIWGAAAVWDRSCLSDGQAGDPPFPP